MREALVENFNKCFPHYRALNLKLIILCKPMHLYNGLSLIIKILPYLYYIPIARQRIDMEAF